MDSWEVRRYHPNPMDSRDVIGITKIVVSYLRDEETYEVGLIERLKLRQMMDYRNPALLGKKCC